ncbi:uncharacterized protein LOC105310227, partial [Pteropus vampyrus]|uniref:Uncharacterized protein LOC105310227 n=1 Tax=Pteropus vampyrus TaxID=132908 RepID=A0A6P6C4S2_PTEVA
TISHGPSLSFLHSEGSNLTPAHHFQDFRFKTYAPVAFRYFRELFGIRPDDYLYSLCNEPLIELSNPGASGSLFYVTSDDEFIIKTVMHKEAEFLQKLLPGYYMVGADVGSEEVLGGLDLGFPPGPVHRPQPHAQQFRSAPRSCLQMCRSKGSKAPWMRSQDPWGTTRPLGHEKPSWVSEPHPGGPFRRSPHTCEQALKFRPWQLSPAGWGVGTSPASLPIFSPLTPLNCGSRNCGSWAVCLSIR